MVNKVYGSCKLSDKLTQSRVFLKNSKLGVVGVVINGKSVWLSEYQFNLLFEVIEVYNGKQV